ncbi:MAG: conjugal transfer protein, partial [Clostridium sp.]
VTTEVKNFSDIGITTFSNKFIHSYFSFSNDDNKRKERLEDLKKYMLDDIVNSTTRNIENMKGISSKVNGVDFWSIEKEEPLENNNYKVVFTVYQELEMPDKNKKWLEDNYYIIVHKDHNNYVIIQNPTITTKPEKGMFESRKMLNADVNVSNEEKDNINNFLNMFFKVYPKASYEELGYYVKNDVKELKKNLEFIGLENLTISKKDDLTYNVSVNVVYKNPETQFQSMNYFEIEVMNENNKLFIDRL